MSNQLDHSIFVQQSALNNVQVEGSLNTGDITQNNYNYLAKPKFFEPKLEQFKPPQFISPKVTPNLIKLLLEHHLLVLGESPDNMDKAGLALHLAWRLSEELQQRSTSGSQNIPIKEWFRSSDPQSLDVALQETETTTIFILSQILPQHVEQDLSRIQKIAALNRHYLIVSTDMPFASWNLPDNESKFWRKLSADGLYHLDDLTNVLIDQLKDAKKFLPSELISENLEPNLQMCNLPLQEVAKRLKIPEQISCFVELLCAEKKSLSEERLDELIDLAQSNENILRRWFHTILNSREQLVAIGLNFFDGLFDDQCIAGIAKLVEHEWHRRDPSLGALDYYDLHNLHNFFRLVEIKAEKTKKFENWPDKKRQTLLEIAWQSYRVRIQTALPVMVELVTNSVSKKSFDQRAYGIPVGQHLYGTKLRRNLLRLAISEAVSNIGLIDNREVQEALLNLASHKNNGVQAVAAYAMARWHKYGHDKDLFDTLKNLKRHSEKKGEKSKDCILSTIALAVGYAAEYNLPQGRSGSPGLSEELCNFLKQLSDHPSRLARLYFGLWTLPMVVPIHVVQLSNLLHDMTLHSDLIQHISESLSHAYGRHPKEVLKILHSWHEECTQTSLHKVPRAALLETLALTYTKILCKKTIHPQTASELKDSLHRIFLEEKHSFNRKVAVKVINEQISKNFQRIEPNLKAFVAEFTDDERNLIVKALAKVYDKQRKKLEPSDPKIVVNISQYPVWISREHTPTEVEKAMFCWLQSEDNIAAQMIGARLLGDPQNFKDPQKEIIEYLKLRYDNCKQSPHPQYEVTLATVALISLEIQRQDKINKNNANEVFAKKVFEYFYKIISQEKHPFIRRTIIKAICTYTNQDLLQIEPQLKSLITYFTDNERSQIFEVLEPAYEQGTDLENKDFLVQEARNIWLKSDDSNINKVIETPPLINSEKSIENIVYVIVCFVIFIGVLLNLFKTNSEQSLPEAIQEIPSSVEANPLSQTPKLVFTREAGLKLINQYLEIKGKIFAAPFDRELAASVTTGKLYEDITTKIDSLQKNKSYYQYGTKKIESLSYFSVTEMQAHFDVKVTEEIYLYEGNSKFDRSHSTNFRFTFKPENGIWKIESRRDIKD